MTLARGREPGSLSHLERWLSEWADVEGVTAGRLRRRVAVLIVAAMLDDVRDTEGNHAFVVKGGSALELRFGSRARTSKDLDTVYRGPLHDAAGMVKAAVETGWHGFTGRVIEVEDVEVPGMTVRPVRFKVKLAYKRKPYGTLPMEVAAPEGTALGDIDRVVVAPLDPVGLPAPEVVSCLSIRYQIAQKLHACTDTLDGEKPNDRAHDLADLILLEELVEDSALSEVRSACIETFGLRNRQSWPPALVVPQHWPALWALVVEEDRFPVESLEEAAARVRALIARIDAG